MSGQGGGSGSVQSGGRIALVTGISGQDGAWLAKLLLGKGYRVTGTTRTFGPQSLWRLDELGIRNHGHLAIVELDVADSARCLDTVKAVDPSEVYNLGGLSFIGQSYADPLNAARVTGLGAWNLLEAIRATCPAARFFQASSSEMFGNPASSPQDEDTPLSPRSPYAAAKVFAHWATTNYRESFGVFASSGILYNHESSLRDIKFVTRKITAAVARISKGMQESVELGNLDARRDWGYAPEYAEAMWRVLQAGKPDTFVLATGRLTTVREFAEAAFATVGIGIRWQGSGLGETGCDALSGKVRVKVSPEFFRPLEGQALCGNPGKARHLLGWTAVTGLGEICRAMVEDDLERLDRGGAR